MYMLDLDISNKAVGRSLFSSVSVSCVDCVTLPSMTGVNVALGEARFNSQHH